MNLIELTEHPVIRIMKPTMRAGIPRVDPSRFVDGMEAFARISANDAIGVGEPGQALRAEWVVSRAVEIFRGVAAAENESIAAGR